MIQQTLPLINQILPAKWVNSVFARHETFHPRFGWLKKGFDAAVEDSGVFLADDATVRLGVGKNMVRSIRYWCDAFKILKEDQPTEFGYQLMSDEGYDPFCEDPASLWLLHWNLLKPPCNAAAWYFTFNLYNNQDFTQNNLYESLCEYRDSLATKIADSSVTKDITCILRMYVKQPVKGKPSEDTLDCPFSELGILQAAGDTQHYTFRVGEKRNQPPSIIVYAALEYASWVGRSKTIAVSRLLYDAGSPGMVFKLSESALCNAIERVSQKFNSLSLSDQAGLIQFSFDAEPLELAADILDYYYQGRSHPIAR